MKWNVIVEDLNRRCFVTYNIFDHGRFADDCADDLKEAERSQNPSDAKDLFFDRVRRNLAYYFQHKAEWEIMIYPLIPSKYYSLSKKMDVYSQVMMNEDLFLNYVWEHRGELRKPRA